MFRFLSFLPLISLQQPAFILMIMASGLQNKSAAGSVNKMATAVQSKGGQAGKPARRLPEQNNAAIANRGKVQSP